MLVNLHAVFLTCHIRCWHLLIHISYVFLGMGTDFPGVQYRRILFDVVLHTPPMFLDFRKIKWLWILRYTKFHNYTCNVGIIRVKYESDVFKQVLYR